jgi:hypothetical protein
MAHGMFRSDNMEATKDGKFLVSLYVGTSGGLDNGRVVKVGNLKTGEREVRSYTTPAATDSIDDVAILGSEEVVADKKYNALSDFTNPQGSIARGYKPVKGDLFSLTADAFTAANGLTFTPGTTICELSATTKLNVANSVTSGSTQVGVLEAVETDGAVTWYVFRVV